MCSTERQPVVASAQNGLVQRRRLTVTGRVQGVGFRPFVYRLALHYNLVGQVSNTTSGVTIDVQGGPTQVQSFRKQLEIQPPQQAAIEAVAVETLPVNDCREFSIADSTDGPAVSTTVTPDLAMCDDCRREVLDPTNLRYRYPFTNCTNCGPRYTIISELPYDREHTAMRQFSMCDTCRAEYNNPANRRFHAQPNACPECGPQLELIAPDGSTMSRRDDALEQAAWALRDGLIVALKGLGGFQLLVDARNDQAILRLRRRKVRPEKPLAVMYPSIDQIREHCRVSTMAETWLNSPVAPIVLLPLRSGQMDHPDHPAPSVSCGLGTLGVMVPYTPLHLLLLDDLGFPVVATSGNRSGDPICIDNDEALDCLGGIADLFLVHNRPIVRPIDDSVIRVVEDRIVVMRLARGLAPAVVHSETGSSSVLAAGGHMKSALAFADKGRLILSQHTGELDTPRSRRNYRSSIDDLGQLINITPAHVACDMHPDYFSTRYAATLGTPVTVQHHLAHILTAIADHRLKEPVLGLAWDGTGLGEDNTIWGGEAFIVDAEAYERIVSMRQFALPGAEQAIHDPRRAAVGLLHACFAGRYREHLPGHVSAVLSKQELTVLDSMLAHGVNSPMTSSIGRLFDAVAALLGIFVRKSTFEGQAAMLLEAAAAQSVDSHSLPFALTEEGLTRIDWAPTIDSLLTALARGDYPSDLARRFHSTLAEIALQIAKRSGLSTVVLSGGCFQNGLLLAMCSKRLRQEGLSVYWPETVPLNDGGLAVGQALAVIRNMKERR